MTTRLRCSALALSVLLLVSSAAIAQEGARFGELYFSDVDGRGEETATAFGFVPFDMYFGIEIDFADDGRGEQNSTNGIKGWEAMINVPAELTVLGRELRPPSSLNVGSGDNFIVGTGSNITAASTPVTLVKYTLGYFQGPVAPSDMVFSISASNPATLSPPEPAWLEFADNTLHRFETLGRFVVNCESEPECIGTPTVNLQIGNETVGTGLVDVPVSIYQDLIFKTGDPSQIAGLDLEISWDSSLATLDDVVTTAATSGWLVEFSQGTGTADISMASLTTINAPLLPNVLEILNLRFDATGAEGTTSIDVVSVEMFDVAQDPIDVIPFGGSLTTGCEKGDVTMDGSVNSADAIRTLLIAFDLIAYTPAEFCAADMNSDGTVDAGDAILVLQKAVGILPARGSDAFPPALFVRTSPQIGEVSFFVENVAGLEATLEFDHHAMQFTGASAPGSNGLTVVNDKDAGRVRLGFAKAELYTGEIQLQFDVTDASSALILKDTFAFDEFGAKSALHSGIDEIYFGVTALDDGTPNKFGITQAYPNPFNPRTQIDFALARPGDATIQVYDAAGRLVRTVSLTGLNSGAHSVVWNGTDDSGQTVASGGYLIRLSAEDQVDTKRVTLIK